jgi:hypothetical protein
MILKNLVFTSGKTNDFPSSSGEDKWINIHRQADKLEKQDYKQNV